MSRFCSQEVLKPTEGVSGRTCLFPEKAHYKTKQNSSVGPSVFTIKDFFISVKFAIFLKSSSRMFLFLFFK